MLMAYINFLDNHGNVGNKSEVIKELQSRCKQLKSCNQRNIAMQINNKSHVDRFIGYDSNVVSGKNDSAVYSKLVSLGVNDKDGGKLYAEFIKDASDNFNFKRLLTDADITVMTMDKSFVDKEYVEKIKEESKAIEEANKREEEIKNLEENKEISSTELDAEEAYDTAIHIVRRAEDNNFYETLYERLMIPKSFPTEEDLKRYVNSIITRINYLIKDNVDDISDFVVYNKNKSSVIINSALIDKFGKVIYFIVKLHKNDELSFTNLQICSGRTMLVSFGFGRVDLDKIKRVRFYDKDLSELIFTADIDDFDLDNWSRLEHCIERQQERLTGKLHDASPEMIYSDMVNAINIGVSISKFDSSYVKPFYSRKYNTISFIIPYHIGNNFQEKPELGIIVSRFEVGDYWQAMTIIDYDMAVADTKLLSLYSGVSF